MTVPPGGTVAVGTREQVGEDHCSCSGVAPLLVNVTTTGLREGREQAAATETGAWVAAGAEEGLVLGSGAADGWTVAAGDEATAAGEAVEDGDDGVGAAATAGC